MHTILYPVNELKIGGAEQQLLELVRGIDKTRFRPVVAPIYPGGALDPEFRVIPGAKLMHLHRRGKYDPSPLWRIANLVRRENVAIIQPFLSPATFYSLVSTLGIGGLATVVTERCGVRANRGLGYRTYRTLEDWLSRSASAIVPNSHAGRELLLARGLPAEKIRVIYNGINQQRLAPDPSAVVGVREELAAAGDGPVVGILASLTAPKGHDTLLRAVARLAEGAPGESGVRLAVVGDGPRRAELEALASELGIARRVVFCGYQRDVASYLANLDLLVSASRDNEGCSNAILEAMLARVPVVATDIGGNRELVRDGVTGALVPVDDDAALAGAIARLLADPLGVSAIVDRAHAMVASEFSLQRMVRDYEELYASLLVPERLAASERQDAAVADAVATARPS